MLYTIWNTAVAYLYWILKPRVSAESETWYCKVQKTSTIVQSKKNNINVIIHNNNKKKKEEESRQEVDVDADALLNKLSQTNQNYSTISLG